MWIQSEVWDDLASNGPTITKGSYLNGIGTLLAEKWIDKNSGEEKKSFKLRILKLFTKEKLESLNEVLELPSISETSIFESSDSTFGTTGFAKETPIIEDQTSSSLPITPQAAERITLPAGMDDDDSDLDDENEPQKFYDISPVTSPVKRVWSKPQKKFY